MPICKGDFHIHTSYSHDGLIRVEQLLLRAEQLGLRIVAITDHNTVRGGLEAARAAQRMGVDLLVVTGVEVRTDYGDILALFVEEEVRARRFREVVREVRSMDGLLALPHPSRGRKRWQAEEAAKVVDVIETVNALTSGGFDKLGLRLAEKYGKPVMGVSDAHLLRCLGRGYTVLELERISLEDVRAALSEGRGKPRLSKPCGVLEHGISALVGGSRIVLRALRAQF